MPFLSDILFMELWDSQTPDRFGPGSIKKSLKEELDQSLFLCSNKIEDTLSMVFNYGCDLSHFWERESDSDSSIYEDLRVLAYFLVWRLWHERDKEKESSRFDPSWFRGDFTQEVVWSYFEKSSSYALLDFFLVANLVNPRNANLVNPRKKEWQWEDISKSRFLGAISQIYSTVAVEDDKKATEDDKKATFEDYKEAVETILKAIAYLNANQSYLTINSVRERRKFIKQLGSGTSTHRYHITACAQKYLVELSAFHTHTAETLATLLKRGERGES